MTVKFKMWSPFHYFMIIFPFVLALILYFFTKDKAEKTHRRVTVVLSIVMIAVLIMRNTYIWVNKGGPNPEVFPFQICHFGNFMFLIALLARDKVWGTIAWCLNFPAGLVSVIFADGLEANYATLINPQAIAYIAGHMLIVTTGLYMLLTGLIRIDRRSLLKMYGLAGLGYVLSVLVNNWFNKHFAHTGVDANYFYSYKPEAGTPLETMFNMGTSYTIAGITFNPVYLLLVAAVAAVLFMVMYGFYKLAEPARPRKYTVKAKA